MHHLYGLEKAGISSPHPVVPAALTTTDSSHQISTAMNQQCHNDGSPGALLVDSAELLSQEFRNTVNRIALEALELDESVNLLQSCRQEPEVLRLFIILQDHVTELESKTTAMEQVMQEEEEALQALEQLYLETQREHDRLKHMRHSVQRAQQHDQSDKENIVETLRRVKLESLSKQKMLRQSNSAAVDIPTTNTTTTTVQTTNCHNQSHDRELMPTASFGSTDTTATVPFITELTATELLQVSRAIRGRLTVAVLNHALGEIYRLTQAKEGAGIVTEQELRKQCAFFRQGEATARSILSTLRALQRLQQVPHKTQILYTLVNQ
jgi:hypothetical protein